MCIHPGILTLALVALQAPGPARPTQDGAALPDWGLRQVEHLWNRAGFGAGSSTIESSLALGPEGLVDSLLRTESWIEEPFYARKRADGDLKRFFKTLPEEEAERRIKELRVEDRAQVDDFLDWWVGRMLDGEEPLRERMVLFWHGHFTSSMDAVRSSYEMIQQNQMFRRHALGSFRELLHAVVHDPAMLLYLDNASSKKSHPNENFARELMELFTLGEGNYSEEDVREVARAFTGWGQRNGRYMFDGKRHDKGRKRVLGVKGRLGGKDVVEILLKQEACARHVARALMICFEGVEPGPERLSRYAALLRESDYRIDGLLRELFLDPEFYAEEKLAGRVSSPLDFLVGSARRIGTSADPRLFVKAAGLLGQRIFYPPSVRGWEGGAAWATGSSLLLRGELAGMLLGRASARDLRRQAQAFTDDMASGDTASGGIGLEADASALSADARPADAMAADGVMAERPRRRRGSSSLRGLERFPAVARINLTQRLTRRGAREDSELARGLLEELLAVAPSPELLSAVEGRLERERDVLDIGADPWPQHPELCEPLLREIAHGILASPEGQLN